MKRLPLLMVTVLCLCGCVRYFGEPAGHYHPPPLCPPHIDVSISGAAPDHSTTAAAGIRAGGVFITGKLSDGSTIDIDIPNRSLGQTGRSLILAGHAVLRIKHRLPNVSAPLPPYRFVCLHDGDGFLQIDSFTATRMTGSFGYQGHETNVGLSESITGEFCIKQP